MIISVINFDCDLELEDGALVYDYNKGEYVIQLLPNNARRWTTCTYSSPIVRVL